MSDRDTNDAVRRAANLEDRTVVGGAPIGGGSTMVSSGAYDTPGGGDLGGPGARDPGDSAGDLRPESADTEGATDTSDLDRAAAERLAQQVFSAAEADQGGGAGRGLGGISGDHAGSGVAGLGGLARGAAEGAGGLDSRNLGGGGTGTGQTQGGARQNQAFGLGGDQPQDLSAQGGANPLQDELRAQAEAQSRRDADEAQGLLDKTRAQTDVGADPNNDNL